MQSVSEHRDTQESRFVLVDRPRPHVALVTLNRPERMNSMAFDVMVPLKAALEDLIQKVKEFDIDAAIAAESNGQAE